MNPHETISKFSSLSAQRMRLTVRLVFKHGLWTGAVILDPATLRENATFEIPNQLSDGFDFVFVNGVPVIEKGKIAVLPGKLLRSPGQVSPSPPKK
jgi:N-acyl-D-amino-acid deacylase